MRDSEPSKIKEKLRRLPHKPGVYMMKDRLGQTLYVGKAKDLKKRVTTYFQASRKLLVAQPKVRAMLDLIHDIETVEVKNEAEALLLEGKLIKQCKPRYNTDFTDDKRFLLVRLDPRESLPRFRLTRNRTDPHCRYYGPFAHAGHLRKTLAELRRRFGILLGDAKPIQLENGAWRLYDDVRAEIYGHANEVSEAAYRERVDAACEFLEGKAREWLGELKEAMRHAAENQEYERAAELRDRIAALERTSAKTRKFQRDQIAAVPHRQVLERLQNELALPRPPEHMECFDISHISGSFCVASMVAFREGKPDKKHYRRFKIRGAIGNDDFHAMEEVVGRRYQRLRDEGRELPDLIVIDGGKGQVGAARKAFLVLDLEPPALVGLAKKNETVVFPDERDPLNLSHHDPALRLLQQVRDEAHRFANSFNAELRSKRLRESVLDDFEGLGQKRKNALLEHFGGLDKLRAATPEQLQHVEGIGPKTARRLRDFLQA